MDILSGRSNMKTKNFSVIRLEKSVVLKRIGYEILATNKKDAIKKLGEMQYAYRDTIDEVREDYWKPLQILDIQEED